MVIQVKHLNINILLYDLLFSVLYLLLFSILLRVFLFYLSLFVTLITLTHLRVSDIRLVRIMFGTLCHCLLTFVITESPVILPFLDINSPFIHQFFTVLFFVSLWCTKSISTYYYNNNSSQSIVYINYVITSNKKNIFIRIYTYT